MLVRTSLVGLVVLGLASGCAAPAANGDPATGDEQDLTALKAGRYAIDSAPLSGSYIASLTINAGKKVELDYVRVTTGSPSLFWPWLPSRNEEKLTLSGTYMTFAGDPGETLISFDVSDRGIDHLIYSLETKDGAIRLKAVGGDAFELRPTTAAPSKTDARVLHCTGRRWSAVITLDQAERRRGSMTITRGTGADKNDPPNGTFAIAYTGDTGVDDYMGYEGEDAKRNGYEFALKKSDLEKTSGPIAEVGLGFTNADNLYGSYAVHNTLACTIGKR